MASGAPRTGDLSNPWTGIDPLLADGNYFPSA
jgi:hypothetical protein